MNNTALVYALWEKNDAVLQHYLHGRCRTVLVPQYLMTAHLEKLITGLGSHVRPIPMGGTVRRGESAAAILQSLAMGASALGLPDDESSAAVLSCLRRQVAADVPGLDGWLTALEALSKDYAIEITVLNEDVSRDAKTMAMWSRVKGIPVLHVAHGTGLSRDYSADAVLSDHIAVPSPRSAEYFKDLGVAAERLHRVGNAHWDCLPHLARDRTATRAKLAELHGLSPQDFWIVWGSTWNAHLSCLDNRNLLEQAVQACITLANLKNAGVGNFKLIFKDRVGNLSPDELPRIRETFMQVASANRVTDDVVYVLGDSRHWAACADVVVSYNSNFSIEALLADTPAIDLLTDFSAVAGGGFGPGDGVLVREFHEVAGTIERLARDHGYRDAIVAAASSRKPFFNEEGEGSPSSRTAALIARFARPVDRARQPRVWQRYLDVESAEVSAAYHTAGRGDLVAMFANDPRFALDIGCAAGSTGALIKERFPDCRVWGVELNRAAAELAVPKLDRVLVGKFEDFDLESEGIAKSSVDAVLLADVLEHMYNPWDLLVRLRPYMTDSGQLLLSIPNVRNLLLMDELSKGNWTYDSQGLLDITHIRFFTFREAIRLCRETGYRVIASRNSLDLRLEQVWKRAQGTFPTTIDMDRLTLKNVSEEEMLELCTVQFYLLIERDAANG